MKISLLSPTKRNLTNKFQNILIKKNKSDYLQPLTEKNTLIKKSCFTKILNFFGIRKKLNPKSFSSGITKPKGPYIASKQSVEQSNNYVKYNIISSNEKIVDGFRDGGSKAKYNKFGDIISGNREVITIDREKDKYLSNAIDYVKQNTQNMSDQERMKFIYNLVTDISGDFVQSCNTSHQLAKNALCEEILLGRIFEKECATCRHKALMFKILSDEVGLKTRVIRGNSFDLQGFGGHAWNEVALPNGKRMLVDIQNQCVVNVDKKNGFNKSILLGYFDADNRPIYVNK